MKNNILYLCVLTVAAFFSSTSFAESTEAGSVCLDEALCAQNNNSALSRLLESLPDNQCPKFTLKQQILRDQQGTLLASSPDEICLKNADNFIHTFENARELESYIQNNPYFSSLNKGHSVSNFSSCLSQGVSIPIGTGPTASQLEQTRLLPENKQKLAVAEYYSSLKRISSGVERSLQNIAAIDVMIGEPVLSGVSCNSLENLGEIKNQCQSFKQCSSSKNSGVSPGLRSSAQDTLLAFQAMEKIEQEIRRLKGPRGRTQKKNKDKIQELEERKKSIQGLYPWMLGKVFKDGYNKKDYANYNVESSQESKKELEDQMAGLIKSQLTYTRDKLKERKEDFLKASLCIRGEDSLCEDLDVPKILAKAPPINRSDVFDSKNKIKELEEKSKEGQLSAQEIVKERQNIRKAAGADSLFGVVECIQRQRKSVKEVNRELALGALDVGIVIGTMGFGSAAVAGRIALRVGGAISKAQKASKAKRLQNLGIFGTDTSLSTPYMKEALNVCEDVMNQLEQTASEETNKICEQMPIRLKHTSDLKSCILQASLASLPVTLPLLGLSGIALAKKMRGANKSVTASTAGNSSQGVSGGAKKSVPASTAGNSSQGVSGGAKKSVPASTAENSSQGVSGGAKKSVPAKIAENPEGVKGPPPKEPWDTTDPSLTKTQITLREAHNRGFFKEDERYIVFTDYRHTYFNKILKKGRIKSFDEENIVLEGLDIDGNLIEDIMPLSNLHAYDIMKPLKMNFFKSLTSRLAAVRPVKYPPFNKEAQMLEKGMKKEISQGLDEAYKMNHLANHLRKSNVNPHKTHIEDFSDQIPEHIRFIREGIKGYKEADEKVKLLDKLSLEASKKQKEKGVTYAWWLQWNHQLTRLLHPNSRSSITDDINNELIEAFPDFVILPTFEDLGIMAINKSVSENVFPLGIVNKNTYADGDQLSPAVFFKHDENHARSTIKTYTYKKGSLPYGERYFIANKEFYEKIQDLPKAQQTQAEIAYFLTTHESSTFYDNASRDLNLNSVLRDKSLRNLLPENIRHSEEEIRSYLKEAQSVYRNLLEAQ